MSALDTSIPPLPVQRVLLIGFGEFERHALTSYLRLSGARVPAYEQVDDIAEADFLIADADHPGAIDQVLAADRSADTVYIGSLAPEGALGWAMRPIDPLGVFRELDAAVALRHFKHAPPPLRTSSGPVPLADEQQPQRRASDAVPAPLALLVDDSEIALRFLQRQLQALGLRTETALHSQGALAQLAQQRFDAVFIDVDLGPDSTLDGFALCQHLKRQQRPHGTGLPPRLVIVSAHGSATDRVRGSFAGCDAYLTKPIKEETMLQEMRTLGLVALPESERAVRKRNKKERAAAAAQAATAAALAANVGAPVEPGAAADFDPSGFGPSSGFGSNSGFGNSGFGKGEVVSSDVADTSAGTRDRRR
jgi:two-component system, cell cycle response regulator